MQIRCRAMAALLGVLAFALLLPVAASAFTAEDYCIVFLAYDTPEDAQITLLFPEAEEKEPIAMERSDRAWETCFRFYFIDHPAIPISWRSGLPKGTLLEITAGGDTFTAAAPTEKLGKVRNLFVWDWDSRTFQEGPPPMRGFQLTALRIVLSLLLEAAAFALFGFRRPLSWLTLAASAAVVQLFFNAVLLKGATTLYDSYTGGVITVLILAEFFIFVIRTVVFDVAIYEHGGHRAAFAGLTANALSCAVYLAAAAALPL